jgi:hypothetical protein
MNTGPKSEKGFDLALTELGDEFVVEVGSEAGREVLADLRYRPASDEMRQTAKAVVASAAEQQKPRSALIIGLGNPDRGDDAAGLLVAESLRERGAEAIVHTGGTLDLIEIWAETERVIVVDAVLSGGAPGTVRTWNASNTVLK